MRAGKRPPLPARARSSHGSIDRRLPLARKGYAKADTSGSFIGIESVSGSPHAERDLQCFPEARGIQVQLAGKSVNLDGLPFCEFALNADTFVAWHVRTSLCAIDAQIQVPLDARRRFPFNQAASNRLIEHLSSRPEVFSDRVHFSDDVRKELEGKLKRKPTEDDVWSYLMYPDVFLKFADFRKTYGDVLPLPTASGGSGATATPSGAGRRSTRCGVS